jgi:hypothetical protein
LYSFPTIICETIALSYAPLKSTIALILNCMCIKHRSAQFVYFILFAESSEPVAAAAERRTGTRLVSTSGRKLSIAVPALLIQQRVQDLFAITRLNRSAPEREHKRRTLLK